MKLFEKISTYSECPFSRQGDVIFDSNTGLYWEYKSPDDNAVNAGNKRFTFDGAASVHVKELNDAGFGGYNDWRVPNKDELRSIFDYGREESVIDDIFGCCPVGDYWTKNIYKLQPYFSWVLFSGFGSGIAKRTDALNFVIAVRGGSDRRFGEPDESRFTDNGDGTVTDAATGLMWQKDTNKRMGPKDAESFIASMDLAGYTDWRLPNIKELNTILNLDETKDNWFFSVFPIPENEKMLHYSACDLFERHYAWVTNFTYGYDGYYGGRSAPLLSRAVRYADAPAAEKQYGTFTITHTGQTRAFDLKGREVDKDRIWGLDAQRIWTQPDFALIEGGKAVKDNITGLIWDNAHDDLKLTWKDAKEYIAGLNESAYLGRKDWRLPGREEIRSIVKYDDSQPAVDKALFSGTSNAYYWTAYTDKAFIENAWGIYFGYGCTFTAPKEKPAHIKAVAGASDAFMMPSELRFVKNGDGTITDKVTGLMWMEEETPLLTQKEALIYCQELDLAGHKDWVMPTLKELATLINLNEGEEWYYKELFPNTNTKPQGFYQSSTVYGGTFGWGVNFQFGFDGYYADRMSGKYPFRPVRRA
ncbi:MAG: DUF1566 domain-containing protein [Lachnospiraceae bacterium]|nr:DUF1566 domain-containing protein [Lachnospiraceae bacterium]